MSETIGRLLAAGNVAEVFEWGSRIVKLYRSPARKSTAFREAAIHATVEAMALPVPAVWGVLEAGGRQPHHGCPLGRPRNGAWVFCTRPIRISPDLAVFAG